MSNTTIENQVKNQDALSSSTMSEMTLSDKAFLMALGLLKVSSLFKNKVMAVAGGFFELKEAMLDAGKRDAFFEIHQDDERLKGVKQAHVALMKKHFSNYNPELYELDVKRYGLQGIQLIGIHQPEYPEQLASIFNAPTLLFIKSKFNEPETFERLHAYTQRALAFVGTRSCSEYGRQVTRELVRELRQYQVSKPVSIISGLAEGIDAEAHREALRQQLPTIAVFGCGLDTIFPSHHADLAEAIVEAGGFLMSEYPLQTKPTRYTFPERNRIVAGLSHGIVVVEGPVKSGALITARLGAEEGRYVYAVPGDIHSTVSHGPIQLIKQGAMPIISAREVLEDLDWLPNKKSEETFEETQSTLDLESPQDTHPSKKEVLGDPAWDELTRHLYQVMSTTPQLLDEVMAALGKCDLKSDVTTSTVQNALMMLELEGWAETLPGNQVRRVK